MPMLSTPGSNTAEKFDDSDTPTPTKLSFTELERWTQEASQNIAVPEHLPHIVGQSLVTTAYKQGYAKAMADVRAKMSQ